MIDVAMLMPSQLEKWSRDGVPESERDEIVSSLLVMLQMCAQMAALIVTACI